MFSRLYQNWRRFGAAGLAARVWSRTLGLLFDVEIVHKYVQPLPGPVRFEPLPGFTYKRVSFESPEFQYVADRMRVNPAHRNMREGFVAIDAEGRVAACVFNDLANGEKMVPQRGTFVLPEYRGHGVGGTLICHQFHELARDGGEETLYHMALTSRGARRMMEPFKGVKVERWMIFTLFRRFHFTHRVRLQK